MHAANKSVDTCIVSAGSPKDPCQLGSGPAPALPQSEEEETSLTEASEKRSPNPAVKESPFPPTPHPEKKPDPRASLFLRLTGPACTHRRSSHSRVSRKSQSSFLTRRQKPNTRKRWCLMEQKQCREQKKTFKIFS